MLCDYALYKSTIDIDTDIDITQLENPLQYLRANFVILDVIKKVGYDVGFRLNSAS